MLNHILNHLEYLVGCDTQNPPRAITPEHRVIAYCADVLEACGCTIEISDIGDGCVNLLATRGHTRTIVNCHLDTVPADPSWSHNPFTLKVESGQAIGLGACDIKGAAACMLAAAQESDGAIALLFTTDEEAGQSTCVRSFLSKPIAYDRAVIAEPTSGLAVSAHRGLATFELVFTGQASHSSITDADKQNAVHLATQWCADAIELTQNEPLDNIRFNIGVIEGGTKANVAASSAKVIFGIRPPPGMDPDEPVNALKALIKDNEMCTWKSRFSAPSLNESAGTADLIAGYGFDCGEPVDFWTEASLFHQAGLSTVVLGPGHINQAHSANEFVATDDLVSVYKAYQRIFSDSLEVNHHIAGTSGAQGVLLP